jgi:hypothetical protein
VRTHQLPEPCNGSPRLVRRPNRRVEVASAAATSDLETWLLSALHRLAMRAAPTRTAASDPKPKLAEGGLVPESRPSLNAAMTRRTNTTCQTSARWMAFGVPGN